MNMKLLKIKKEIKKQFKNYPKQYKRKPTFLTGHIDDTYFERVVEKEKGYFHCELCICAGENAGPHEECDYLDFIFSLIKWVKTKYDQMHLFKWEYDVCDDIWYAFISVVIGE